MKSESVRTKSRESYPMVEAFHPQASSHGGMEDEEKGGGIQFSPPLYLQRYHLAMDYLTKHNVENVVDLGCSECGFFPLLSTLSNIQDIALVDIDRELLVKRSRVISPDVRDYVHRRCNPLHVFMYAGSAGDYDQRLAHYTATTLIEVIEHLHPDVLESVTSNVFGSLQPEHVVITTPNSEFNVLFKNDDPTAFRHWDHKFEWTRQQFQSWCSSVCERFGYGVEYSGVGFPTTDDDPDLGPCSQAAFFRRKNVKAQMNCDASLSSLETENVYELIAQSEFPYDTMSVEEKLDCEIMYTLRQIARLRQESSEEFDNDLSNVISVPVDCLIKRSRLRNWATPLQVKEFLLQRSFQISEDQTTVTVAVADLLDDNEEEEDDDQFDEDYHKDDDNDYDRSNQKVIKDISKCSTNQNVCCQDCDKDDPGIYRCESDWDLSEIND